jgi:hypothetical protein
LNPNIERFMRSVKEEYLGRVVFFGERALYAAVAAFLAHYHAEPNHQAFGNRLIVPGDEVGRTTGDSHQYFSNTALLAFAKTLFNRLLKRL